MLLEYWHKTLQVVHIIHFCNEVVNLLAELVTPLVLWALNERYGDQELSRMTPGFLVTSFAYLSNSAPFDDAARSYKYESEGENSDKLHVTTWSWSIV